MQTMKIKLFLSSVISQRTPIYDDLMHSDKDSINFQNIYFHYIHIEIDPKTS